MRHFAVIILTQFKKEKWQKDESRRPRRLSDPLVVSSGLFLLTADESYEHQHSDVLLILSSPLFFFFFGIHRELQCLSEARCHGAMQTAHKDKIALLYFSVCRLHL